MIYLVICLLCLIGIEVFIALPFLRYINALTAVSQKAVRVTTSSKISDHWKEKVLQRYSRDMAVASLMLGFLLIVLFGIITLASSLADMILQPDIATLQFFVSIPGLITATIFSLFYVSVRKHLVKG
jgi:hypothetical protein